MHKSRDIRIGLVGYGWGGRYFHAPVIEAAAGAVLAGVVTTSETRRTELENDHPGVHAHDSLESLLSAGVDVVVLSTPPHGRGQLAKTALDSGAVTILDKPFALDANQGRGLTDYAHSRGARLGVYQNRRWDSNISTLRSVLDQGSLGDVHEHQSVFDQYEPRSVESAANGGTLLDLGSHMVDQSLWLFGAVSIVSATLTWTDTTWGVNDSAFTIRMKHTGGVTSLLAANKLARRPQRVLTATGTRGTFESTGPDTQAEALLAGLRPAAAPESWGIDPVGGILHVNGQQPAVVSTPGRYHAYYEQLVDAVRQGTPLPVGADDAMSTLRVLDAARRSATSGGSPVVVAS